MPGLSLAQPDISLELDEKGIIREASLSNTLSGEAVGIWVGRSWSDIVGETSAESVRRMVEDARNGSVSAFRQVVQRFPSGRELPVEYTTFRAAGKSGGMIALGRSLQAVTELQTRLAAAQQATEREYWKLRDVETRYRLLFDASPEAVLMIGGEDLRIMEANPAAVRALGLAPGWEFSGSLSWAERETFGQMLQRVREQGRAPGIVLHLGAGREPWAVRATLMGSEPGLRYLLHIAPAGAKPLREGDDDPAAVDELIERLPDGFVILDGQGSVLRANEAFLALIHAGSAGAVRGQSMGRWMSEPGADISVFLDMVRQHRTVKLFQTILHGELGTKTQVEVSAAQYDQGNQQVVGLILRDVGRRILDAAPSRDDASPVVDAAMAQLGQVPLLQVVRVAADTVEREMIKAALDRVGGNRTAAAELLGLSRQSLHSKLNRYTAGGE